MASYEYSAYLNRLKLTDGSEDLINFRVWY